MNVIRKTELTSKEIGLMLELYNRRMPKSFNKTEDTFCIDCGEDVEIFMAYEAEVLSGFLSIREGWGKLISSGLAGKLLLEEAKKHNDVLFGWVSTKEGVKNGEGKDYKSPINFYLNNGFKIDERRNEGLDPTILKVIWKK